MKATTVMIILVIALSGAAGLMLSLRVHHHAVEEVHTIETFHYPATFIKQLQGDKRAGEKIFKEFCSSCHAQPPVIDVPAPRIGDRRQWRARRQQGMNVLLRLTIEGYGAMPARGGCFECSDNQLREAIRYILQSS